MGELSGVVVTADALHTLAQQAEALHARGAHYVFTVKANQPGLRDRIASQTWASLAPQHTLREKSHGRTTTWQITAQPAQAWVGFPHAEQTIRLTRDRIEHRNGEATREPVYAITSLSPEQASPAELAALIRGHWHTASCRLPGSSLDSRPRAPRVPSARRVSSASLLIVTVAITPRCHWRRSQ